MKWKPMVNLDPIRTVTTNESWMAYSLFIGIYMGMTIRHRTKDAGYNSRHLSFEWRSLFYIEVQRNLSVAIFLWTVVLLYSSLTVALNPVLGNVTFA